MLLRSGQLSKTKQQNSTPKNKIPASTLLYSDNKDYKGYRDNTKVGTTYKVNNNERINRLLKRVLQMGNIK